MLAIPICTHCGLSAVLTLREVYGPPRRLCLMCSREPGQEGLDSDRLRLREQEAWDAYHHKAGARDQPQRNHHKDKG